MARGGVAGDPDQVAGLLHRFKPILDPTHIGEDFLTRLVLQKSVYLVQDWASVPFGYSFHWWHRGPYSSALARDSFDALPLYRAAVPRRFSDEGTETRFAEFLDWLASKEHPPEWFELVGSARFLRRRRYPQDEAKKILRAKLPLVKEQDIDNAWGLVGGPPPPSLESPAAP